MLIVLVLILGLLAASSASAEVSHAGVGIREIYPGSVAQPDSEYVELQLWADQENPRAGDTVRTYNVAGALTNTDAFTSTSTVSASEGTLLLATPAAIAQFGVSADLPMTPGLDPAGGAVCWGAFDCVTWGTRIGALLPGPIYAKGPAIPDGMAIRRNLDRECATTFDYEDVRYAALAVVAPAPRSSSSPTVETPCPPPPPNAKIVQGPPHRGSDRTPTFRFDAHVRGTKTPATFQCRISGDGKPGAFRPCSSPFTAKHLGIGGHVFKVRAVSEAGVPGAATPGYHFAIVRKARR